METNELISSIKKLKKEKNAIILAHNYQIPEVQDIADVIGDSLKLAQEATKVEEKIIVFCGVHFMAESAKILNPEKTVLLPNKNAGCPMADMVTGADLKEYKEKNPETKIVSYVNTSAEVKAYSDICCTSSNAVKVVKSLDAKKILFVPDKNLGGYVSQQIKDKEFELWEGFCPTHERVTPEEAVKLKLRKPGVKILTHPECPDSVVKVSDFVGSTGNILNYVKDSEEKEFIIGTEMGILHTLRVQNPDKKFTLLSEKLICPNMKKIDLNDVYEALKNNQYEINVEEEISNRAYKALKNMLDVK